MDIKNGLKKAGVAGAIALASVGNVYAQEEPRPGLYVKGDERCLVSYPGGRGLSPSIECRTPGLWTEANGDAVHAFRYVGSDGVALRRVIITGRIVDFDARVEREVAPSDRKSGITSYRGEEAEKIRRRHGATKKSVVVNQNYHGPITDEKW